MNENLLILLSVIFWVAFLGLLHTYLIYPVTMLWLGRTKRNRRSIYQAGEADWPEVHVVMAMYNEAEVIKETVESIVEADYPADKLTLHIGSDDSNDGSNEIVAALQREYSNIRLTEFDQRSGKIKIVNSLIDELPTDSDSVLILGDANVRWSKDLPLKLVRHFKDPRVGMVATNVLDENQRETGISLQEEAYVNRENRVKFAEGVLWGRVMGAFGACYGVRRSIYQRVPEDFNVDDFFQTLSIYQHGYEGIVDLEAICFETVSDDISEEFRRKKRISKGNFQNLRRFFAYLLPWNGGITTSYAFWSHKGLRWFGPLLIALIILLLPVLALFGSELYSLIMVGFFVSFLMAGVDKGLDLLGIDGQLKLCKFARYFYSMNLALLMGGIEFIRGVRNSVWEPTRRVETCPASAGLGD